MLYLSDVQSTLSAAGDLSLEEIGNRLFPTLGTPAGLAEFVAQAYAAPTDRHPLAYIHSNGFLKVEFTRANGLRLRAHFWSSEWNLEPQNPHDHGFEFRSKVVIGTLVHREFEVSASED